LTVAGEKGKGILGEAELNLSDYLEGEYKSIKLTLDKCVDNNAFIEVGLRATKAASEKKKKSKDNGDGATKGGDVNPDQLKYLV
jgi:hypothetical protein